MEQRRRINCTGILVVDALSGPLAQYPEPGVRPQVVTSSLRLAAGGGAANTGSALARMGLSVGVFSKVGDDATVGEGEAGDGGCDGLDCLIYG